MDNFIVWLFESFTVLIEGLTMSTITLIAHIFRAVSGGEIIDINVNLVLFSETPILTVDFYDLLTLFFGVFYTVIFIVIVWKIIKKVFVKITGWKKW